MINPKLPIAALLERFARERRIVIDQFLQPAAAEALYGCLLREVPWEIDRATFSPCTPTTTTVPTPGARPT